MPIRKVIILVIYILLSYSVYLIFTSNEISGLKAYGVTGNSMIIQSIMLIYIVKNANFLIKPNKIVGIILLIGTLMLFSNLLDTKNSLNDYLAQIFGVSFWFISFLFSYLYVKRNPHDTDYLSKLFIFFIFFFFYLFINLALARFNSQRGFFTIEIKVYYILLLLPFAVKVKNLTLRTILLVFISFAVFISFKRSAFIGLIFSIGFYFLFDYYIKHRNSKFTTTLFSLIYVSIAILGFNYIEKSSGGLFSNRFMDVESDEGSGRTEIWKEVMGYQMETSVINWFVGSGYNAVAEKAHNKMSAHNDFLETLYDYGVFVFLLYIGLHISLIYFCKTLSKNRSYLFIPFTISYILFLTTSFFSHLLNFSLYFIFLTMFWGIAIAEFENAKTLRIIA